MSVIEAIHARQILDSRGNPTVEVDLRLDGGAAGRAAVPSGASTGSREALELRDGGSAFRGKGVTRAVANVNGEIADAVVRTRDVRSAGARRSADRAGRHGREVTLGRQCSLGVSMAAARAAAVAAGQPLWRYLGGERGSPAPRAGDECPQRRRARGQSSRLPGVHGRPDRGRLVRRRAADGRRGLPRAQGHAQAARAVHSRRRRGWLRAELGLNEAPLELLVAAIEAAGYRPGDDVAICLDPAASEFFHDGRYELEVRGPVVVERGDDRALGRHLGALPDAVPRGRAGRGRLGRVEAAHRRVGDRLQLVGDDVFVTNPDILRKGIERGIANAS